MSRKDAMVIDEEHLRDNHEGTVEMGMQLWASRNRPCGYNTWQSLYFQLLRRGLADPLKVAGESTSQLQQRLRQQYATVMENLHGPDFRAAAIVVAKAAKPPEEAEPSGVLPAVELGVGGDAAGARHLSLVGLPTAEELALDDEILAQELAIAGSEEAQQFELFTPREGVSRADSASPEHYLMDPSVQEVLEEWEATHTEHSDEFDERMLEVSNAIIGMQEEVRPRKAALEFLIRVEHTANEYRQSHGQWVRTTDALLTKGNSKYGRWSCC